MEVLQDTYKDTKIGRIPKEWEVRNLNKCCGINKDSLSSSTKEDYSFYYLDLSLVKKGIIDFPNAKVDFKNAPSRARRKIKKGDILMSTVRPNLLGNGYINFDSEEYIASTGFAVLSNYKETNGGFLYHYLYSHNMQSQIERMLVGSNYPAINNKDVSILKIPFPLLKEQQKIAAILSTVDEQISKTDQIIEKSKELKKGLMQKLFSEGIGHTEFKDTKIGRIPKDWEVTMLSEIGIIKVGRDLNKGIYSSKFNEKYKVPVYSNAITDRGLYGFYSRSEYPPNSITITGRGNIGFAFQRDQEFGAIGRLIVIQPNSNVDYVFLTNYINHSVNFHIETSGIPQLTGVQASKYKVALPHLPEQQKIAAILSEADAKIEKEQIQKVQLEALKKGLMQQLLTGTKRVKV